jgi:hypothetical protein
MQELEIAIQHIKEQLAINKHLNNGPACQKWGSRLKVLQSAKLTLQKCKEELYWTIKP